MNTSHRYLAKSATRGVRKIIGGLVLFGGLVFLAGCPNPGGGTKDQTKPTTTTDPTQPSGPGISTSDISVSLNENGPETMVNLPFKSQGGAVPTSCETSLVTTVVLTKPCACSAGVCSVGVKPPPGVLTKGSFDFRFSGQNGISSNTGKASVDILEVKLAIHSGNRQTGEVGKPLGNPIVVSVRNSHDVPVPGVEVFWAIDWNLKLLEGANEWTVEQVGKLSSCADKTNDEGVAQCTWTLGTRIPVGTKQGGSVSAFSRENTKNSQKASFTVTAKPGPPAILSYWTQSISWDYTKGTATLYQGPRWPAWQSTFIGKPDVVGEVLGKVWDEESLVVFARDQHGNTASVPAGIKLTLALAPGSPAGAVLLGDAVDVEMKNYTITGGEDISNQDISWTQGLAIFLVKVNKAGTYPPLSVTSSTNPTLRVSTDSYDFTRFIVQPGAPFKLGFGTQPGGTNAKAGAPLPTQPVVNILDSFDNITKRNPFSTATTDPVLNVRVAVDSPNPGGTLGGTSTVGAVNGVATFSGLFINGKPGKYKLTASSEVPAVGAEAAVSLASPPSDEFSVDLGDPYKLKFRAQPSPGKLSQPLNPQPVVEVQDRSDNITTTLSHTSDKPATVTLAIPSDLSSLGGTLGGGNTSANIVNGVATFNGLLISGATAGLYKLTATGSAVLTVGQPAVTLEKGTTAEFKLDP